MNKSLKRSFSTVLAAAIVVCSPLLGTSTQAESTNKSADRVDIELSSDSISGILSKNDIPECLDFEAIADKEHTTRLFDKETGLDTVLFANKDGSETVYIFNEDVKYIDANGRIADKSNKLYSCIESKAFSSDYSYVNKENDINTYFPKSLKTDVGVSVEAQGQVIEMYPMSDVVSKVTADNDMYGVYYDDVFGEFTGIRYEPGFSGYKEDIVLEKNVGNKFSFILETGDLVPVLENGVIYIRDGSGADFGLISPTYVYDSFTGDPSLDKNRHFTYNNRFELTNVSDGKYELVVIVDEEFLDNPATVYPVIVDPSVIINVTGSGSSKSILDTPIYDGSGAVGTAGANSLAIVGRVDSSYGSGRLLMRFPGLMNQSFMSNQNYIITSAKLFLNEVSGSSVRANISAYTYNGPAWTESSVYNSSIWNGIYEYKSPGGTMDEGELSTCSFSYPNLTNGSFNITQAVRLWHSNRSYGLQQGIILKNATNESDSTYCKTFYTSEGSTKPYLSVTYSMRSESDDAFLSWGSSSKVITLKLVGAMTTNSTWYPLITSSCNAWNNSNAKTKFTTTTTGSSPYSLTVAYYTEDWFGFTDPKKFPTSVPIMINTRTLPSSSNVRLSTITHELGHLIYLKDNPTTSDYSLMCHDRDREMIYIPQMSDIYHVLKKY